MCAASQRRVLLGRIVGARGVRGEVLIHTFTSEPEGISTYGPLSDASGARTFHIRAARTTAKGVVAVIAGIADRNAAEALKGTDLYVDRDRLPPIREGEFYHADLVGLAAVDSSGKRLGEIVGVANYGAGDLIEIRKAGSAQTEMVPFNEAVVHRVDVAGGYAVIVMPDLEADSQR